MVGRRDEATVDGEEAAAQQDLLDRRDWFSWGCEDHLSFSDLLYLDQLFSAVKLRHQHVPAVGQPGEGHAEPPGGPQVGVGRELLQEGVPEQPQQAEGRVENPQGACPRRPRQVQQVSAEAI